MCPLRFRTTVKWDSCFSIRSTGICTLSVRPDAENSGMVFEDTCALEVGNKRTSFVTGPAVRGLRTPSEIDLPGPFPGVTTRAERLQITRVVRPALSQRNHVIFGQFHARPGGATA